MINEFVKCSHKMSSSYSTMNIRGMLKDKKALFNLNEISEYEKIMEEIDS